MRQFDRLRSAVLVAAVLLAGIAPSAKAATSMTRPAATELTECLGYYTIGLPGAFEYALMNDFSEGLGAWGAEIRLGLANLEPQELSISRAAGMAELAARMDTRNKKQQGEKDEFLSSAKWRADHPEFSKINDPDGEKRRQDLLDAERVPFAQRVYDRDAIYFPGKDKVALDALVNGHILSTTLPRQGTPEQTLDAFLSHYKPRALGEVPSGPGVCVPYGFFTDERQPATIGLNIRLKDQPDIVVYLRASDAATDAPDDPGKLFDGLTPISTFFGSRQVTPLHKIKPLRAISIDGAEGLGSFVRVLRKAVADQSRGFNNAAEGNEDWGYFAYIPGKPGGKPGESFNLMFRVERFGRFAKAPMTEKEFRELTLRIAASIKRRPGAWAPK